MGVDLSSAYVAAASDEAARMGRSDAVRFIQGDFLDVAAQLPAAAVVALDRVICCYPEPMRLLHESLQHADRCFALSYPRDLWYGADLGGTSKPLAPHVPKSLPHLRPFRRGDGEQHSSNGFPVAESPLHADAVRGRVREIVTVAGSVS